MAILFGIAEPLAESNHLGNFDRGHYEEHFYEITLNLDQWFRCCLRHFLSRALAVIWFAGVEPFRQFWNRALGGTFVCNYFKFGPAV